MFLNELAKKIVYVGKNPRGVCLGIGISVKSQTVKYLLCASLRPTGDTPDTIEKDDVDFAVSLSSVEEITENAIYLSSLRAVFPKNSAKIFLDKPIYSDEGIFLGNVTNVLIQNAKAVKVFTDKNSSFSLLSLSACSDALILRKEPPFPIGQRVPAPLVSHFSCKNDSIITRSILRSAIQKGSLIKLTLSLPPFSLETANSQKNQKHFL